MDEKPLQDKDLEINPRFRGDFRCVCLAETWQKQSYQMAASNWLCALSMNGVLLLYSAKAVTKVTRKSGATQTAPARVKPMKAAPVQRGLFH